MANCTMEMCPGLETPPADGVVWSRDGILEQEPRSRVAAATLAGLEVAKQKPRSRAGSAGLAATLAGCDLAAMLAGLTSRSRAREQIRRSALEVAKRTGAEAGSRRVAHGLGRVGPWSDGVAGVRTEE